MKRNFTYIFLVLSIASVLPFASTQPGTAKVLQRDAFKTHTKESLARDSSISNQIVPRNLHNDSVVVLRTLFNTDVSIAYGTGGDSCSCMYSPRLNWNNGIRTFLDKSNRYVCGLTARICAHFCKSTHGRTLSMDLNGKEIGARAYGRWDNDYECQPLPQCNKDACTNYDFHSVIAPDLFKKGEQNQITIRSMSIWGGLNLCVEYVDMDLEFCSNQVVCGLKACNAAGWADATDACDYTTGNCKCKGSIPEIDGVCKCPSYKKINESGDGCLCPLGTVPNSSDDGCIEPTCRTFQNYVDTYDKTTTLVQWCSSNHCCQGNQASCKGWSTSSKYHVCRDSCNGFDTCKNLGQKSESAFITISQQSCIGNYACTGLAYSSTALEKLTFSKGACNSQSSCTNIAWGSSVLKTLSLGEDSCSAQSSCTELASLPQNLELLNISEGACSNCYRAAYTSSYLQHLSISQGQCDKCNSCESNGSTAISLELTNDCCSHDKPNMCDVTSPIARCQNNLSFTVDSNCEKILKVDEIDSTSSDDTGVVFKSFSSTELFESTVLKPGNHNVTLFVKDVAGNSDKCSTTVQIRDKSLPSAECKQSFNLYSGGACRKINSLQAKDIDDGSSANCGIAFMSIVMEKVDFDANSENSVGLEVTDTSGNNATCTTTLECICKDNTSFNFTSKHDSSLQFNCAWISQSLKRIYIRQHDYCFEDKKCKSPSRIGLECQQSCGFCDESNTDSCLHINGDPESGCMDVESFMFPPKTRPDTFESCAYITRPSNRKKVVSRRKLYCNQTHIGAACPHSCDKCNTPYKDDQNYTFPLMNVKKNATCKWLVKNKKKTNNRIMNYCLSDKDCTLASQVGDRCPVSCGFTQGMHWNRTTCHAGSSSSFTSSSERNSNEAHQNVPLSTPHLFELVFGTAYFLLQ